MKHIWMLTSLLLVLVTGCKKYEMPSSEPASHTYTNTLALGADVSWITQMESEGLKFYNTAGEAKDGFQLMKDLGVKAIRLRVWVNPANGWNNLADVTAKAKRAHALGLKLMIDFHYSDSWADPAQQVVPAAWSAASLAVLKDSVYNHTFKVLNSLKTDGITADWVQVGNETNDGMLWPTGRASSNMANFATLISSGYDAVKAVNSSAKVIVHLSNGYDSSLYRWMFDGLTANNAKYDVIGMSLYPEATTWPEMNKQCEATMKFVTAKYGKEVILSEAGMPATSAASCKRFIEDLSERIYNLPNQKGLGIFYWEPQAYNSWQGYALGAFDATGKPTVALDAFR